MSELFDFLGTQLAQGTENDLIVSYVKAGIHIGLTLGLRHPEYAGAFILEIGEDHPEPLSQCELIMISFPMSMVL